MKLSLAVSLLLSATPSSVSGFANLPRRAHGGGAFVSSSSLLKMGIMDEVNSDSFDLLSNPGGGDEDKEKSRAMDAAYETFLAELVFSTNDPRIDIVNNIDRCADDEWLEWLNTKIQNSKDPEERNAMRDLYDMIVDIKEKMELAKLQEEREEQERQKAEAARVMDAEVEAEQGRQMSNAEVLKKASAINTAQAGVDEAKKEEKKSFYDQDLTPEIRMSYEKMLKKVLPPYDAGDTFESIVFKFYDQFDAQFVKVLEEMSSSAHADAKTLLEALAVEQQKRISAATEVLKSVLALGDPMRMEGAIVKLAREGKVDEPFLLLLEANANQARAAGADGPAQLMDKLSKRAVEEKDKQMSSKEIRLIRKLLRSDDSAEREKILEDAFTPREGLIVAGTAENAQKAIDGEIPEQDEQPMPDVPPPDFINACKAVLLNFGNLGTDDDRGDLATRIKNLSSEAEVVATRIYGKGMTLREQQVRNISIVWWCFDVEEWTSHASSGLSQTPSYCYLQDRAWKEETTSIFDLERMELEAEAMGESAPWTNPDANDDLMPGFDMDGKMKIGGT